MSGSPNPVRRAPAPVLAVDDASLDRATRILLDGGLVAMPTETVYGLAADATNGRAVASIYTAKGRPSFNPLICHVSDLAMAENCAEFSPLARALADRFWPGPLTLVLPRATGCPVSELATAGLDTIALRMPKSAAALELIRRVGRPLAAPSANPSERLSPTSAASRGGKSRRENRPHPRWRRMQRGSGIDHRRGHERWRRDAATGRAGALRDRVAHRSAHRPGSSFGGRCARHDEAPLRSPRERSGWRPARVARRRIVSGLRGAAGRA